MESHKLIRITLDIATYLMNIQQRDIQQLLINYKL